MRLLSKSRLMSARQCLKRAWLESWRGDLASISANSRTALLAGQRVGEVARRLYGGDAGHFIADDESLDAAIATTRELVRQKDSESLFEAAFSADGVLVRADVLQPDGAGWRLVEVKASTERKPEHEFDCAIQSWVLRESGVRLTTTTLAHVNNGFRYAGDGDYRGLLIEKDVRDAIDGLLPLVAEHIGVVKETLQGNEPDVPVGKHCTQPWECPFMAHCWPADSDFPVQGLGGSRARLGALVAEGYRDLRDVPPARLTERQRRIQTVTQSARAELSADAAREIAAIAYPRYYLDFETVAPPVPIWAGARPYEALPFQWSCHFEAAPGNVRHADFLDLTGDPPMRRVAESLIRVLGSRGAVLMYTAYERQVIERLIAWFPDLAAPLSRIVERLLDLQPLVKRHYYHPDMRGSWSLKAVTPTVAPDLRYSELQGIQEGTEASEGYIEAIDPRTSTLRKQQLEKQLRRYCHLDTEAMVRLTHFLGRAAD